jgi:hypothetical protein
VKTGTPTAESVTCTEKNPELTGQTQMASLNSLLPGMHAQAVGTQIGSEDSDPVKLPAGLHYTRFTNQHALGDFLAQHYDIRNPRELTSCEVCHR